MTFESSTQFAVRGQNFHTFEDAEGRHRIMSDGPKLLTRKFVTERFGVDYDAFANVAGATYPTRTEAETALRDVLNKGPDHG